MTQADGYMITAEGRGGQVSFDGQFVTIYRRGLLARATAGKGDKRIPLASITAVQWKPAGAVVNGFIQFTIPGGNESRSRAGRQTSDAAHDENSVIFTRKQQEAFETFRSEVEAALARRGSTTSAAHATNAATQLTQLAELHRTGALSDEEFAQAKARLLA